MTIVGWASGPPFAGPRRTRQAKLIATAPIARNTPQCAAFASSKTKTMELAVMAPRASLISAGVGRRSRREPREYAVSSVNAPPNREKSICIQKRFDLLPRVQRADQEDHPTWP